MALPDLTTWPSWGLYTITAAPPDGSDVATTNLPNIAVHGDMAVTITLAAPVTLRGRILDGLGMPLANQDVTLTPAGGTGLPYVITDDGGNYAFAVAPGEYDWQAYGYPRGSAAPQDRMIGTTERLALTRESRA